MSAREFEAAARRQPVPDTARPLCGAWVGTWRDGSGRPLSGKVKVIISGDDPLPSWAPSRCRLGAHDYLVQMEAIAGVFPLWAEVDHDTFILRMDARNADATFLSARNVLGPSDEGENFLCSVLVCAPADHSDSLNWAFWGPPFARRCDYVLHLDRFVLPRRGR